MSVDAMDAVATPEPVDVLVVGAGQAGLAAARSAQVGGLSCLVVEAREDVGGSWPDYYDSLRLFSPARFSALPGLPMPGPADRYPTREEMTGYLRAYANRFGLPVRTSTRVVSVARHGGGFTVTTTTGQMLAGRSLVAASGGFGRPYRPALPGAARFTGRLLHTAAYRRPDSFAGRRVVVVGRGNSAVQIATELAEVADVTLAVRRPLRLRNQRPLGVDVHHWSRWTGLDRVPVGARGTAGPGVLDDGRLAAAIAAGRPETRPMFSRLTAAGVVWPDGREEPVDVVLLATGYRPELAYLAGTGALDERGRPVHCRGTSTTVPGTGVRRAARADRVRLGDRPRSGTGRPPGAPPTPPAPGRSASRAGRLPVAGARAAVTAAGGSVNRGRAGRRRRRPTPRAPASSRPTCRAVPA